MEGARNAVAEDVVLPQVVPLMPEFYFHMLGVTPMPNGEVHECESAAMFDGKCPVCCATYKVDVTYNDDGEPCEWKISGLEPGRFPRTWWRAENLRDAIDAKLSVKVERL